MKFVLVLDILNVVTESVIQMAQNDNSISMPTETSLVQRSRLLTLLIHLSSLCGKTKLLDFLLEIRSKGGSEGKTSRILGTMWVPFSVHSFR